MGVACQGIAQRERAMRRQLHDEAIGQRLDAVILLVVRLRLTADRDDGSARGRRVGIGSVGAGRSRCLFAVRPLDRRFVLRPYETAFDQERAVAIDADEGAGAGDLGRIEDMRPIVKGGQRLLNLAEAGIDLVGKLVGVLILGFELRLLGLKGFDRRLLLGREVGQACLQAAAGRSRDCRGS